MQLLSEESYRKRTFTISKEPRIVNEVVKIQRLWRAYQCRKNLKKMIKKMKSKSQIANQLIVSEKAYCENLKFVIDHVMIPSSQVIDDKQIHELIFSTIEDIYLMHNHFFECLESVMKTYSHHKTQLSTVIQNQLFGKQLFKPKYSYYCANYRKSNQMAKLLFANNASFKNLLRKIDIYEIIELESYLIKPMQRLCKYQLLLNSIFKNTESDHIDYENLQKTIGFVENLVKQTNKEVEQFLLNQRFKDIKYDFNDLLKKIPNPNRKLLFTMQDISLIDLIADKSSLYKELFLFNDTILVVPVGQLKPIFCPLSIYRELPNLKYFKNLVQLIHMDKYLTIEFKKQKNKEMFVEALKKTDLSNKCTEFIEVQILGTETRASIFKNYTVYIAQIKLTKEKIRKVYPRFKDMLRIQSIIESRKITLNLPSLNRETYFVTNKSKTIEKRKLIIQEYLQKIINCKECYSSSQIFKILNLKIEENSKKIQTQVTIFLPNSQPIKIMVDSKNSTVKDVKDKIANSIGLIYHTQFQLYEMRNNKVTRLIDEDQSVLQIVQSQTGFSFNPFRQNIHYLFTRSHYIDPDDEFCLYKNDFVRAQLELSVIKSEILKYRLQQQLMITFMCLFALYINVPVNDDSKLSAFIKEIGKKEYKISKDDFRSYYKEVHKKVEQEEDQLATLPFLIIKIISNSPLYRCRQFDVVVHPKSFKSAKGYIPSLEEKITLGIKNSHALLLTQQSKHIVQSFNMDMIQVSEVHPTSIILQINCFGTGLRLDTQQAFEISKLFQLYKDKI